VSKRGIYAVRLSGLSDGEHDFQFVLDQEFFASLEQSEIEKGEVEASVMLEKKPGAMSLDFQLTGSVEVTCDRCLEPFMAGIETSQTIYVKLGETPGEIEDDVIMIHKDDHEIEVGQLMYEFIVLALPLQRIHPENDEGFPACDPEMIRHLDHQGSFDKQEENDPRWDALKEMIGKKR
jgi:uncharacterized metal-binding protein YceD (DUF177 family)